MAVARERESENERGEGERGEGERGEGERGEGERGEGDNRLRALGRYLSLPGRVTGVPRTSETAPSWDPSEGLCLGPYGDPRGGILSYERGTPVGHS